MTLIESKDYAPREVFSVSQIEKAFGSAHEPERGCLRSWAIRYLAGLKEPEYTYEEALNLPEHTPELQKFKGGTLKKTYGKVFHSIAEEYFRGNPIDLSNDAANRFFSGSHLAPHPSQCAEIEIEKPIKVKTGANMAASPQDASLGDYISWNGFKDLVVRTWEKEPPGVLEQQGLALGATYRPSPRYLFDWKTTTPTVDNRRNRDLGKPAGSWTWQKDAKAIKIDFQANLYAYDEYVNFGALPRGRWIYFANSGKPDARATDYEPELPLVLETVKTLDRHARVLREYIRDFRGYRYERPGVNAGKNYALDVEPNLSNCAAFGGCPYRSSVGGPCTAEQSGVIPVGTLSKTLTRPNVKPRDPLPAIGPGFAFAPQESTAHMGLAEDIANAKAQRTGQAPAPTGFAPTSAPPVGVPPHVPGYSTSVGAPIPTQGMPAVFSAPTVPGPAPAPATPTFDPSFAFGAPVVPPTPPSPMYPAYGTPTQNPDYLCDGQGGYVAKNTIVASAQAGSADAQNFLRAQAGGPPVAAPVPPVAETFPSHVNPPEASNPSLPTEAPKRTRGRPPKVVTPDVPPSEPARTARDTDVVPADFAEPELTVTLKLGRMHVTVPAPAELVDTLQAYVLKAVSG